MAYRVILFIVTCISTSSSLGQLIWSEDFNGSSTIAYSTSTPEFTDGSYDYFINTDGSDFGTSNVYNGAQGNFFAACDIDGEGAANLQTITWSGIDISDCHTILFSVDLAESDASDGNEDWDWNDYVHFEYKVDAGTWQNLMWFEAFGLANSTAGSNQPSLDNDFNNIGEGTVITNTFQTFSTYLGTLGNTLDLRISIRLDAGDEDIAIDNLKLTGNCTTPSYSCIWTEDFSTQSNGTQNDAGGKWTTSANNCDADGLPGAVDDNYWGVYNGEFRVNDIEGLTCPCALGGDNDNLFLSQTIDISGYTQISLSITLRAYDEGGGGFECDGLCNSEDRLTAQYEVDGGGWVTFAEMCGVDANYSALECIDVPNGSILQIRVLAGNQSNDENYYFDNINVCEAVCAVVLPVELVSFRGEFNATELSNHLTWETNSERNNDYFIIEKLEDNMDWRQIARVSGSGTTSIPQQYNFDDTHPSQGLNYYRISQVDYNGQRSTHNTIAIQSNLEGFELYPNPTIDKLNIECSIDLIDEQITVINSIGRVVYQTRATSNSFRIDLNELGISSGVYTVVLGNYTERLVIR